MSPDVSDVSSKSGCDNPGYKGFEMRPSKAQPMVLSERSSMSRFGQTIKASRSLEQPPGMILQCRSWSEVSVFFIPQDLIDSTKLPMDSP